MARETSQKQRKLNALSAEYFKVDERSLADLYREVQEFSRLVNFYPNKEPESSSDWSPFFENADAYLQKLSSSTQGIRSLESATCPPHLALLLSFLKLFGHTQQRLNELTNTHLKYFYQQVLNETKKSAITDKVYLFGDLAKNVDSQLIPEGEQFVAGKDEANKKILFANDRTVVLNNASIAQLMSIQRSSSDNRLYSFPVSNSADGWGAPLVDGEGWSPFGNIEKARVPAEIGFGFASPMLSMKEGRRSIAVTLAIEPERKNYGSPPVIHAGHFEVQLTSVEGWVTKKIRIFRLTDKAMEFSFDLNEIDPPIVPYDRFIHGYSLLNINYPILKVTLAGISDNDHYRFLQSLHFTKVTIRTEIKNLHSVGLRNDYGELDTEKPFHPFGFTPVRGSNFYLGVADITGKPVDDITLKLNWKGLPESFKIYYEGYMGSTNSLVRGNEDFKISVAIKIHNKWIDCPNKNDSKGEYSLFTEDIILENAALNKARELGELSGISGIIRVTLTSPSFAFGHTLYPAVYAKAIIAQIQNKDAPIPNEPFTPIMESVQVAYTATDVIDLAKSGGSAFRYFHFKPFGVEEKQVNAERKKTPLITREFKEAGSLLIGIENIKPPTQITIFFEIKEDSFLDKPEVFYHFLGNEGWRPFSSNHILSDTTGGLQQTGILIFNLPGEASLSNTSLPTGYAWIKISTGSHVEAFDKIVTTRTNCFVCTRIQGSESTTVNALPPFSIASPLKKRKEIKKIEQPYPAFGGKAEESLVDYFVRSSERLRHKMKGITSWDIERIILDEFPEIYKVKCIQHEDGEGNRMPGSIHVIVIPYIRPQLHAKVLRPFVPSSRLKQIHEHIKALVSPHADLSVTNPTYEDIKVVLQVNFLTVSDTGYFIRKLQDDLQTFLSPWAFKGDTEIELGGKLYRSSVIEFIESLPYVNFISSIHLLKNGREVDDQLIAPDERSVLISSDSHDIESVPSDWSKCQANLGIEEMIIDINFEVQ